MDKLKNFPCPQNLPHNKNPQKDIRIHQKLIHPKIIQGDFVEADPPKTLL